MAILQITPPTDQEERKSNQYSLAFPVPPKPDSDFNPTVLSELKDEISRSRVREAFWISMVVHMILAIAVVSAPKWMPARNLHLLSVEDMLRDKDATFLALPPDEQKITAKPKTNIISDKDRIATSKAPQIDRKTLKELRDNLAEGLPGGMNRPQPPTAAQQAMQQQPTPNQGQGATPPPQQTAHNNNGPSLQAPDYGAHQGAKGGPLLGALSAGSSLQQAAQAAAMQGSGQGVGGQMGLGRGASSAKIRSDMEITTDTQGVDFGPYLSRLREIIMRNWEVLIPESARPPLLKQGTVRLDFVIMPNGRVRGLQVEAGSGDTSLDRAAWGAITGSDPFPPLPAEFHGPYLGLRCRFLYNPSRNEVNQ